MNAAVAPSPAAGVPRPLAARECLAVAAASLLASLLFWSPLLFGGSLNGYDWSSHHFHYFDWVRLSLVEYGTLPLYMSHAWITPNFLANAEAPTFGPLVGLLALLPTGAYIKLLVLLYGAAGLAGAFLLLRDLAVPAPVAAAAAALFAWSGFFPSHIAVGHPWAMGANLLPGLVWLYRRAALGSDGALWAAAGLNASAILAGQHQPFVWQNLVLGLFAGLWALRRGALFPLERLALLGLLTAGGAALKLLPMWAEFRDYAPTARIEGLPVALLLPSLGGRGQGPEWSPAGLAYAHGAGWWEYAFYLGPLGLGLLALGLAGARRAWPWLLLGLVFVSLALEPGPWPLLEDLPILRTQRAPSRFLLPGLFGLWLAAAVGLGRGFAALRRRRPRAALAAAGVLAALLSVDLFAQSLPWQRAALGAPIVPLDPRPRPRVLHHAGGAGFSLVDFAPNRLVYRVRAERPARVVLPLRFGKSGAEWELDGLMPVYHDGNLAVEVPKGSREIALRYRPPGLVPGAAISAATLAAFGLWLLRRGRRRRSP